MTPLISAAELLTLRRTQPVMLVDARTGSNARQHYQAQHLRGAQHVDLALDLAGPAANPATAGRHPLPELQDFAQVLGRLGIAPGAHVVVYDTHSAANAAARFWWMLTAVGHSAVQVLDGGLEAALAAGVPVSADVETSLMTVPYPAHAWGLPTATADDVAYAAQGGRHPVIDVREAVRYRGEREPIDAVAGHIPGAVNVPFSSNLAADGTFLAPEILRRKYGDVLHTSDPAEAIVHCGSGVTACHTLLAMAQAGLAMPRLYVGSWSEWSRSGRPIATGNEGAVAQYR